MSERGKERERGHAGEPCSDLQSSKYCSYIELVDVVAYVYAVSCWEHQIVYIFCLPACFFQRGLRLSNPIVFAATQWGRERKKEKNRKDGDREKKERAGRLEDDLSRVAVLVVRGSSAGRLPSRAGSGSVAGWLSSVGPKEDSGRTQEEKERERRETTGLL